MPAEPRPAAPPTPDPELGTTRERGRATRERRPQGARGSGARSGLRAGERAARVGLQPSPRGFTHRRLPPRAPAPHSPSRPWARGPSTHSSTCHQPRGLMAKRSAGRDHHPGRRPSDAQQRASRSRPNVGLGETAQERGRGPAPPSWQLAAAAGAILEAGGLPLALACGLRCGTTGSLAPDRSGRFELS